MKCSVCNSEIPEGLDFCLACGTIAVELSTEIRQQYEQVDSSVANSDVPLTDLILHPDFDLQESLDQHANKTTQWRATSKQSGQIVDLLKISADEHSTQDEAYETACRATDLNHQNVIPVYGVHKVAGDQSFWISMEPVQENSLADILQTTPLSNEEAIDILCGLVRGITYIHKMHFEHAALSPDSIFLQKDKTGWIPKIGIFGTKKTDKDDQKLYRAPEQKEDAFQKTQAADIFSLGRILLQILSGNATEPVEIADLKDVPNELIQILTTCLNPKPEQRYATLKELLSKLEALQGKETVTDAKKKKKKKIVCPVCKKANDLKNDFCSECSAGLTRTCGECNAKNSIQAKICSSCATPMDLYQDAIRLRDMLKHFESQKKWTEILDRSKDAPSYSKALKGKNGQLIVETLNEIKLRAKNVLSKIKESKFALSKARKRGDDETFLREAELLEKLIPLDVFLKKEVEIAKARVQTAEFLIEKKRRLRRKIIKIATSVLLLLLLNSAGKFGLYLFQKRHFEHAIIARNLPEAIERAKPLDRNHDANNRVNQLKQVLEIQKSIEATWSSLTELIQTYEPTVWTTVETLRKKADQAPDLAQARQLYGEITPLLQSMELKYKAILKQKTAWETMLSEEFGEAQIAPLFPKEWSDLQTLVQTASKERDLGDAEVLWFEVRRKTRHLIERCRLRIRREQNMLLSKKTWIVQRNQAIESDAMLLEDMKEKLPKIYSKIDELEKKAIQKEHEKDYVTAEKLYSELTILFKQAIDQIRGWTPERVYRTAIEQAKVFVKNNSWKAALASINQAENSGHTDLSEAILLRGKIKQEIDTIQNARLAYEKKLAPLNLRILQGRDPVRWNELQDLTRMAEKENNSKEVVRLYADALKKLENLVQQKTRPARSVSIKNITDTPKENEPWTAMLGSGLKMSFLPLASSTFTMGSDTGKPYEQPEHPVLIREPLWLATTEVTLKQFALFMRPGILPADISINWTTFPLTQGTLQLTKKINSTHWEQPVTGISWETAILFCEWMTQQAQGFGLLSENYHYTLPTEAQWEYACRAGTTGDFAGELQQIGWYKQNSAGRLQPVGLKRPNAWGFFDLHGNAAEWVLDHWHNNYNGAPSDEKSWLTPGSIDRVYRGGSAYNGESYCKSSSRAQAKQNTTNTRIGFRVALTRKTQPKQSL